MSERLERLQREIAAERDAVLAELGLSFTGPLLVPGDVDPTAVIEARLARVPVQLREEARVRLRRSIVAMPWLRGRRVQGAQA
jgi:hypothetical protein